PLVVVVRERLQMLEQIIAKVEFHVARDPDEYPSGQELEDAFAQRDPQYQQGISQQLLACDAMVEVIHRTADHLGKDYPNAIRQQQRNATHNECPAIPPEIGEEGLES